MESGERGLHPLELYLVEAAEAAKLPYHQQESFGRHAFELTHTRFNKEGGWRAPFGSDATYGVDMILRNSNSVQDMEGDALSLILYAGLFPRHIWARTHRRGAPRTNYYVKISSSFLRLSDERELAEGAPALVLALRNHPVFRRNFQPPDIRFLPDQVSDEWWLQENGRIRLDDIIDHYHLRYAA